MAERIFESAMTRWLKKGQKEAGNARPAKIIVSPGKIQVVAHDNKFPTINIKTTELVKPKPAKGSTSWIVLDFVANVDAKYMYINFQASDSSKTTMLVDVIMHAWSGTKPRPSGVFTDNAEDLPMLPVHSRPPNAKPVPPTAVATSRSARQRTIDCDPEGSAVHPQFNSAFNKSSSNQPKKQTAVQLQGFFDEYGVTNKSTNEQQKAVHKKPDAAKTHASTSGQQKKTAPLYSQQPRRIIKNRSPVDNRNDGIEGSFYSKPAPVTRTTPLSAARSGTKDSIPERKLPLRELAMQGTRDEDRENMRPEERQKSLTSDAASDSFDKTVRKPNSTTMKSASSNGPISNFDSRGFPEGRTVWLRKEHEERTGTRDTGDGGEEGRGEVCRFPYQYKSQHNIGNSCYMNATLQVLAACPLFVMQVDQAKESLKKPSQFFNRFGASMMWLNGLHISTAPVSKGVLEGLRTDLMKLDKVFEEGDGKAQQDAEEALTAFLGAVSDECTGLGFRKRDSMASRLSQGISSPVKTPNPIKRRSGEGHSIPAVGEEQSKTKKVPAICDPVDLMEVQMRDVRTCRSCGHVNYFEAVEHRVHLGVGVAEKKRKPWTVKCVEQLLAAEVAVEEIITDYGCEKCATKGIEAVGTKQFVVFGEYIIIVLKRFGHDENHRLRKLTMPIRVPIYLEMADFLGGGRAAEHNPLNKTIDIDDNETSVKKERNKKKEEIKKMDPAEKMKKETDNWVDLPSEDEKVSLSTTIDEFYEGEKMEDEEEKEGNETMEDDGEKKEEEEGAADETEIVQLSSSASAEIVDDNPAATEATSLETQNSDACVTPITRSKRAPRLETPGTVEVTAMSRSEAEKFKATPTTRKRVRSPPSRGKDERASTGSRLSLSDTRLEKRSRLEEKKKLTGSSAASSPVVVDDVDIIIDEAAMEERERSRRSSMEKKNPIWAALKEEVKALPKKDPYDFDFDSDNEAGDVARPTKQAAAGNRKFKLQRKPLTHQNGHVKKEKESPSKGTGDRRKMKNENISPLNSSMEQTGGGGRRTEGSDDDRKKAKREEEEEVDEERIGGDLDKVTRRSRARSNRMSTIVIEKEEEEEEEEDGEDIFLEGNTAVDQKGEPEEPMEYGSQEGGFVKEEEEAEECSSADEVVQATPPDAIEQEEEKEGAEKSNNEMKVESMEEGNEDEEERYVKTETTATETDATTESSLPDEDDVFGSDFTDRHERGDLSSSKMPRTSTSTTVVEETKIEESSALNDLLEEMEMEEENEKKEEVPNDQTDFEKAFRAPEWNERMAEWRTLFKDTDPSPPRDYMTFRPVDDRWMMDMCKQLHLDCVITRYDQHPVFAELRAQSNLCPVTTKPQADDIIDMDGDGNCLFRAISWWVTGAEAGHELMRFRIVDFMVKFPDQFGERMSGEPGRKYTKEDNEMLKDGEWGTQCEIYGAATLLGVDIYTYHEKRWKAYRPLFEWTLEDGTPQMIRKTGVTERTRFALYLTNPENLHYDVVKYMKPVAPMSDTCYRLLATILHKGETSTSGHYIADVYDQEKDQWVHCDDERITKRDILEVLEDAMQLGYVFIYGKNSSVLEKQKKKKK